MSSYVTCSSDSAVGAVRAVAGLVRSSEPGHNHRRQVWPGLAHTMVVMVVAWSHVIYGFAACFEKMWKRVLHVKHR